jgi:hypothetical protein
MKILILNTKRGTQNEDKSENERKVLKLPQMLINIMI